MSYTRVVLLTIFLSLWTFNLDSAAAAVTASWGDVVDVNYSLWLDEDHTIEKPGSISNTNVDLHYIYLRRSQNELVPSKVLESFPESAAQELNISYLQNFIDAIIGMQVEQEKDFMITAEEAYGEEDLYYDIKLLEILYDASEETPSETTTTTTSSTDPFQDLTNLLLIGGSVIILGGGFVLWRLHISRTYKSALSEEKMSSVVRAKTIQKDKDQIKELRKLTESVTESEDTSERTEVKFRPRRR